MARPVKARRSAKCAWLPDDTVERPLGIERCSLGIVAKSFSALDRNGATVAYPAALSRQSCDEMRLS